MQIQLDGKNIDLTDGLKEHTHKKLEKLTRHSANIQHIHIVFSVEKHLHIARATLKTPQHELAAKEESEDLYKSIDQLIDKLDRLVIKHKDH